MMCSGAGILDDRWSGNAHLGGRGKREEREREEKERGRKEWEGEGSKRRREGEKYSPRVSWKTQIAAIQTGPVVKVTSSVHVPTVHLQTSLQRGKQPI